jgi:hypothetical protein
LLPNVALNDNLGRIVLRIYDRSPTFRIQSAHIAAARDLQVRVRLDTMIPSTSRAITVVSRQGREVVADIHLRPTGDYSEIIAHEFEHLLEQIEGMDLRQLARVRGSRGTRRRAQELRDEPAQSAGRAVAHEFRSPPEARINLVSDRA